jgi:hypothetical protein
MTGGTYCAFQVGVLGASADNVGYNLREQALRRLGAEQEDLRSQVLLRNIPDYVTEKTETFSEFRRALVSWAEVRERLEIRTGPLSAESGPGKCRSHYRAQLAWSLGERPSAERVLTMADEFLKETCPESPAITAVHWNTDNVHAHIWVDARRIDGQKLNFTRAEWRSIDERWNRIYCRETGRDPAVHLAKKAESARYWTRVRGLKEKLAGAGDTGSWRDAMELARAKGIPRPERFEWTYHVPVDPITREAIGLLDDLSERVRLRSIIKNGDVAERKAAEESYQRIEEERSSSVTGLRYFVATEHLRQDGELWRQFLRLAPDGAEALADAGRKHFARTSPDLVDSPPAEGAGPLSLEGRPAYPAAGARLQSEICQATERPVLERQLSRLQQAVRRTLDHADSLAAAYPMDQQAGMARVWQNPSAAWERLDVLALRHGWKKARGMVQDHPDVLGPLVADPKPRYIPGPLYRPTYGVAHSQGRDLAASLATKWQAFDALRSARKDHDELEKYLERCPHMERIGYALRRAHREHKEPVLDWLRHGPPAARELAELLVREIGSRDAAELERRSRSRDGMAR